MTLAIHACTPNAGFDTRADNTAAQSQEPHKQQGNWRSAGELTAARGSASCVSKTEQLAHHLGAGKKGATTLLYFNPQNEREELISSVILNGHQSGIELGIMDIAQGENCVATYEVFRAWAEKCSDVLFNNYPNFSLSAAINPETQIYNAGENLHLITWQLSGNGCLTLQKEILH
ncbi:MAG: hypothetical protein ABW079_17260 [Sedimenticola sp.]